MGHLYLKKTKQRISTFCLSQGFHYAKGKWTQAHLKWLKSLELGGSDRETLDEYLITYEYQTNRIEAFDLYKKLCVFAFLIRVNHIITEKP